MSVCTIMGMLSSALIFYMYLLCYPGQLHPLSSIEFDVLTMSSNSSSIEYNHVVS